MDTSDSTMLAVIVLCIMMSAYFSATETAFSSLNRIRLKTMADKGNKKAILTLKLVENYDKLLTTILIGNNIVNILSSSLSTILFVKWLGDISGPTVSTIVVTIVVLIFGEITPKSIAKEQPEKFALWSSTYINALMFVCAPVTWVFSQWKKLMSKVFKSDNDTGITEEELISIVEEANIDGAIDEQESMIIQNAIDFTAQEAGNIITPRIEVTAISVDATNEEIAQVFTETAYSRLPIYKETIDHVIGAVYHKDFYNYVYGTNNTKKLEDVIRPVVFASKNKKIGNLLKELQSKKSHMAIILDEYGGTLGLCTLEDILEELVGEIWDEHDEVETNIKEKSDTECIVAGNAFLDTLFEYLEFDDTDEFNNMTVSMWIMNMLGRCPKEGDKLIYKNVNIEVLKVDEHKADTIRITKTPIKTKQEA